MKLRLLTLASLLSTASILLADNRIGFIEKFALATDREATLTELVPGTEDYYFFHALHYQSTKQAPKLAAILEQWAKRFPQSAQREIIKNREALLAYDTDPKRTLKFLTDTYHLEFNDVQTQLDQKPDLPTVLDAAQIAEEVFRSIALQDDDLGKCSPEALAALVSGKVPLLPPQRRAVLARLTRPNIPGLVEFIAEELKTPENHEFGEFEIHRQLLPEQLDQLAKLVPRIASENAYVYARIRKLGAGADEDTTYDATAREAWLDRTWNYAKPLPPAFNSLKARILYQRLEHDRGQGKYDQARFLEYLKLPRQTNYIAPKLVQKLRSADTVWADLNANLNDAISIPPVGSDEPLVRDYFLRLFAADTTKTWEFYAEWVRDTWLKPVYAESMIVNGIGEPEKWAPLLTPAAYQQLKERVDLDFEAPTPPFITPAADVNIDLFVKNAPKLIVKVYELNALNYFLTHRQQLNTDLPLDGLVANSETTQTYADSPLKRIKRSFKFPELKGRRGAWMIEFIGGGRSSRVLIRKGQWQVIQRTGSAGDRLTVLNEDYAPITDTVIWLDGRQFTPDPKSGDVTIPFTAQPGKKQIVLANPEGTFATLTEFDHHEEKYSLDAQFHIEREQLLRARDATVAIRANLRINETILPTSLLQDPKLTITTTTLDGINSTREIKGLSLDPARALLQRVPVPDRLATLTVVLSGKIDQVSKGGEKLDVTAQDTWNVNGIDHTEATFDAHFTRVDRTGVLELLGKNGEPIADRQVICTFVHERYNVPVEVALRTDERGRINLTTLPGIAHLSVQLPDDTTRAWNLTEFLSTASETVQVPANTPFEVPLKANPTTTGIALFEMRNGLCSNDASAALGKLPPAGAVPAALSIASLAPGDYELVLPDENRKVTIKAAAGTLAKGWVINSNRLLELTPQKPLRISKIEPTANELLITLANANPFARVHVVASRYSSDSTRLSRLMNFPRFGGAAEIPARLPNLFAAGRDIGDEYRYILERRYTQKYPGNMLSRPGLLLNPWEKRSTDQSAISQAAMEAPKQTAGARGRMAAERSQGTADSFSKEVALERGSNLDFLATLAPVAYNLVPDVNGVVRVPRKLIADRHLIQVYAEDLQDASWKQFSLPESEVKHADLRLTNNLDPAKPFAEKKEIRIIGKGETLTLPDIQTSEVETYDSLASVYALLQALSRNGVLPQFSWILEWPTLKDDAKRAKYSEFACHELNFFLSRKDPDFFTKVIQPYLRNKKDKTFFDDYLIGSDLARYVEPWRFGQLNAVERALLSSRLQRDAASIARHLRETWELLPPNPNEEDRLFESALYGRAIEFLSTGDGIPALESLDAAPAAAGAPAPAPAEAAAAGKPMLRRFGGLAPAAPVTAPLADAAEVEQKSELRADTAFKRLKESTEKLSRAEKDVALNFYGDLDGADARLGRGFARAQAYYRKLGATKEWAENNYYRLPIQEQGAELITVNTFWKDFAEWVAQGSKAPFLSPHFVEAHRNFSEMMLALAVLDLPFQSGKPDSKIESNKLTINAAAPFIAVLRQIKPAKPATQPGDLLVSQNFYRLGDRYRMEGNEQFDKYVADEFLAGVVYGANVVVTNPTSSPQKLALLLQIPRGALPVSGSKATDSKRVHLQPFTTQSFDYFFYFPQPNNAGEKYPHYPVNIARNEDVVGSVKPFTFQVVSKPSQVDKASWEYISQYGTDQDVFAYLDQNNIERTDLSRIAWRCRKSIDFFRKIVGVLEQRHKFEASVYKYGFQHNDPTAMREWLRINGELTEHYGPYFDSRLAKVDPVEQKTFEQLDYSPLVNQRAHRLGAQYQIANNVVLEQYRHLLKNVAYKPAPDTSDTMAATTFLFLQDRVEEGLARLATINADSLPTRLQYDYFQCYSAFYTGKLAEARGIANQYADFPVQRWQGMFSDVIGQLDEIEGKSSTVKKAGDQADREADTASGANTQPTFDFKVENRTIALTWKNLKEVAVNYYLIDPEFSFSSNPFVSEDAGRFSIIRPSKSAKVALPDGKDTMEVPIPPDYAKSNVVVEVTAAGQRKAQAYHANTLKMSVSENFGRLELRDQQSGAPISKAYVKVYARLNNGTIRFFRDGYTDLRGKFDYASLNSSDTPGTPEPPRPLPASGSESSLDSQMLRPGELDNLSRFSILVLSDNNGALVREASPPRQ